MKNKFKFTELLIFSAIVSCSCNVGATPSPERTADEKHQIRLLLSHHFGNYYDPTVGPFGQCVSNSSAGCDLVIHHLKNAREHEKNQRKIKNLNEELRHLTSEQTQRPVKNRLDAAKKEFSMYTKTYWATLSTSDQDLLITTAAELAEKQNTSLSYAINKLEDALNK